MQIIIVCGNDDCRQEYKVDTNDRYWECPHCGRKRESDHYPFLTAKLMQARIDGDAGDWETIHNESVETAAVKVQENDLTIARLEHEAGVAIEGETLASEHQAALKALKKEDDAADGEKWRARAEGFIKKARAIMIEQEDRIKMLEGEPEKKKAAGKKKDGKAKGPVRKGKKELGEENIVHK
jgi:hypothetical protein